MMTTIRIVVHELVLLACNLVGVIGGFGVHKAFGTTNQVATQVPIAVLGSVVLYLGFVLVLRGRPFAGFRLGATGQHWLALAASVAWNPVVFVPLHYVTQGYLTAPGNIIGLALFQVPVNAIALVVAWRALRAGNDGDALPVDAARS